MKVFYFLLIFFINYSNSQQNEFATIEYIASTRGSSIEFIITNSNLTYTDSKKSIERTFTKSELKKIHKSLKKIDLNSIHTLPRPSSKSHHDGAMAATISIECNGENFESSTFDHGNPPQELKALINYIFDLIYTDSN